MALNPKIADLSAFNRKNSGVGGVEHEKTAALTALNRENSCVNSDEPEK